MDMNEIEQQKIRERQHRKEALILQAITFAIALATGGLIFVIYYFAMGAHFIDAVNGMALTTIILVSAGILSLLARLGAFDTFAYGFKQLATSMFSKNTNKYNNMADYKKQKYDERKLKSKLYIAILVAAAIFAVVLLVLEILYHSKY